MEKEDLELIKNEKDFISSPFQNNIYYLRDGEENGSSIHSSEYSQQRERGIFFLDEITLFEEDRNKENSRTGSLDFLKRAP